MERKIDNEYNPYYHDAGICEKDFETLTDRLNFLLEEGKYIWIKNQLIRCIQLRNDKLQGDLSKINIDHFNIITNLLKTLKRFKDTADKGCRFFTYKNYFINFAEKKDGVCQISDDNLDSRNKMLYREYLKLIEDTKNTSDRISRNITNFNKRITRIDKKKIYINNLLNQIMKDDDRTNNLYVDRYREITAAFLAIIRKLKEERRSKLVSIKQKEHDKDIISMFSIDADLSNYIDLMRKRKENIPSSKSSPKYTGMSPSKLPSPFKPRYVREPLQPLNIQDKNTPVIFEGEDTQMPFKINRVKKSTPRPPKRNKFRQSKMDVFRPLPPTPEKSQMSPRKARFMR